MTPEQQKAIDELRAAGYAIIIYRPEELRQANPVKVQDRILEQGWDTIACLQDDS